MKIDRSGSGITNEDRETKVETEVELKLEAKSAFDLTTTRFVSNDLFWKRRRAVFTFNVD